MLGQRRFVGVAVELVENSELAPEKLIPVEEVLASIPPLSDDLRALARFVASYYHEPIGLCFAQLLPPLGQARTVRAPPIAHRCSRVSPEAGRPRSTLPQRTAQSATADKRCCWCLKSI